jgi:hypothetical protein
LKPTGAGVLLRTQGELWYAGDRRLNTGPTRRSNYAKCTHRKSNLSRKFDTANPMRSSKRLLQ